MFHPTTVRQAAHLVLVMGACWQLPALAVNIDTPLIQARAVVPPALMLGKNWQASLDPSAYLVSEKLDGVRALWDGQVLRFRSGRLIAAPKWFLDALPATSLDGELWMGRQSFDRVSAAVRRQTPIDAEWQALKYMVFDLPGTPGTFAERSAQIVSVVGAVGVPWMQPLPQIRGTDADMLQRPRFDMAELERVRAQRLAGLQQEKARPQLLGNRVLPSLLFDAAHPYSKPLTGSGYEAAIKSISREDMLAYHNRWVRPENATLVVVGNTTLKELVPMLQLQLKWTKISSLKAKNYLLENIHFL